MSEEAKKYPAELEIIFFILIVVVVTPLHAFVFFKGWQWFVEPIWQVSLSFWACLGLKSLLTFVLYRSDNHPNKKSVTEQFVEALLANLFFLGWMYIIKQII